MHMSAQVVEHIPKSNTNGSTSLVAQFVRRMMSIAKVLLVTTTYGMPYGAIHGHWQVSLS